MTVPVMTLISANARDDDGNNASSRRDGSRWVSGGARSLLGKSNRLTSRVSDGFES